MAAVFGWGWSESIDGLASREGMTSFGPFPFLLVWAAALLASITVHELGHALTAEALGCPSSIVLYHFGGLAFHHPGWKLLLADLGFLLLAALLWTGSRDTLRKYYQRTEQLLSGPGTAGPKRRRKAGQVRLLTTGGHNARHHNQKRQRAEQRPFHDPSPRDGSRPVALLSGLIRFLQLHPPKNPRHQA